MTVPQYLRWIRSPAEFLSFEEMNDMRYWANVLDPDSDLHLWQTAIRRAWAVRKPTHDGIVTSVELFDERGEFIIQFFGKWKPQEAEFEGWRAVVAGLPRREDPF